LAATKRAAPDAAGGEISEPSIDGNGKKPASNRAFCVMSLTSQVPVGFIAARPEKNRAFASS
jgi:hypothetical protein